MGDISRATSVVTSISFDLYGCVQAIVTAQHDDAEKKEGFTDFYAETKRPPLIGDSPIMPMPTLLSAPLICAPGSVGPHEVATPCRCDLELSRFSLVFPTTSW